MLADGLYAEEDEGHPLAGGMTGLQMPRQSFLHAPEQVLSEKPAAIQPPDPAEAERIDNGGRERYLVLAAQRGDSAAFHELYDTYLERIWTLVVYSIGNSLHAQDVLQTVFLKVFQGLRGFRFQSSLFTWIYRIAHNECLNYHRRRSAPHVPLETILGSKDEIDTEQIWNNHQSHLEHEVILQQAVMQLPFKMREVVILKYVEGLSYKEMSKVLGCAAGTVASRLNRALAELEERLRLFRRLF